MSRKIIWASVLAFGALAAVPVQAQSVAYYKAGMPSGARAFYSGPGTGQSPRDNIAPSRFDWREADQLRRWGRVGRCVAASDRAGSLAYVHAPVGTDAAELAKKRIAPAFSDCLEGSGIVSRRLTAYRRAAVADALGIPPAR